MTMVTNLIVGVLCLTLSTHACPKSYFGRGESCYVIIRVKASWAEAAAYCSAIGAQLAVVDSDEKQNFLKDHLFNVSSTLDHGVWIGGMDYLEEGTWMWGNQRGAIVKTYWGPKDPNNLRQGNTGQDCLMLYKDAGFTWDDHFCSAKEFFLCEREAPLNPQ